jgi:hypothetical protein
MSADVTSSLEHRWLRPAIEFAVAIAAEGQKVKPPIEYPAALKPFLRQPRIPSAALGKLRRAIEADPVFRRRLSAGALPELVDRSASSGCGARRAGSSGSRRSWPSTRTPSPGR